MFKVLGKYFGGVFDTFTKRYRKINRRYLVISAVLLLVLSLAFILKGILIAATVNWWPIPRYLVWQELEAQGGKQILDGLITKRIVLGEAKKAGQLATQSEVDEEVKKISGEIEKQGGTLESALLFQGQTVEQFKEQILLQKTVEKMLSSELNVADEEIKKYFEENKSSFDKGATLESEKDSIIATLRREKLTTAFQKWLADAKAKAKINYFVSY